MSEALLCFLVQYLGFGLIFFFGLAICFAQGSVGFSSPRLRRNLFVLVGGYVFYVVVHGFFQFVVSGF